MTTRILKQMMLILALASQTANANDQSIRTTLALTTTVAKGTTDADVERAETLLVMLEAEASMHTELSVVERRQIGRAHV